MYGLLTDRSRIIGKCTHSGSIFYFFFLPWSIRLGKQLFVGALAATMVILYENTAQNRDYQGKSIGIESRLVVAWGWEKGLVANRP